MGQGHGVFVAAAVALGLGISACGRTETSTGASARRDDEPMDAPATTAGAPAFGAPASSTDAGRAAPKGPSRCRVTDRFTVVSEPANTFAFAAAVLGEQFGLLWLDEGTPWRLRFRAFTLAGEPIAEPITLSETPLRPKVALAALRETFAVAWIDWYGADRLRFTTFQDGQRIVDRTFEDTSTADDPSLATTERGELVLSWTRSIGDLGYDRAFVRSPDGSTFGMPSVLATGPARPAFGSSVRVPGGVGHAWVARMAQPNRSALLYATLAHPSQPAEPAVLVDHARYIYATAMAFGAGRIAIATTDSRVNIGTVPLYLTLLTDDGALLEEGIRLTNDHHHQSVDIAAGSGSFVLLTDAFVGAEAENRVFLHQVDRDGKHLFEPLRVSAERVPPGTRNAQQPRLAEIGADRYLAVWGERESVERRTVYVIRAGIVDCQADAQPL